MARQESRPCFQALSLTPATSDECLSSTVRGHSCGVLHTSVCPFLHSKLCEHFHARREPCTTHGRIRRDRSTALISYIPLLRFYIQPWALYSNPATSVRREEKAQARHSGAHPKSQRLKVWGEAERQVSLGYIRSLCQKTEEKRG